MNDKIGLILFLLGMAMQLDYRIQTPINTPNWQVFFPIIIMAVGMFMYLFSENKRKKSK